MTWSDIEDALFDGTKEQIEGLCCPDCGEKITYEYLASIKQLNIACRQCGKIEKLHSCSTVPNCSLIT